MYTRTCDFMKNLQPTPQPEATNCKDHGRKLHLYTRRFQRAWAQTSEGEKRASEKTGIVEGRHGSALGSSVE